MKLVRNKIAIAILALASTGVFAAPPGIRFHPTLMAPDPGKSTDKVRNLANPPAPGDIPADHNCAGKDIPDCGALRVGFVASHMGYNDPLLYAIGSVNASHLHTFWGAIDTDGDTDQDINPQDLGTPPNSTSRGGTVNRSRYWVPAAIDDRTGLAIKPSRTLVYYKGELRNMVPPDFRMIAGNSASTSPQSSSIVTFGCNGSGCIGGTWTNIQAQPIAPGKELFMMLDMPECLAMDGVFPYGTMSGSLSAAWKWILIGFGDDTNELMYRSETADANVTDIVVSGGGGAAAPTVVTVDGTSETRERAYIRFVALTAGQSVTVAGHTYTSTGDTTAAEVAKAFSGGTPVGTSPDFKSHVAYDSVVDGVSTCPAGFPYHIPAIRLNAAYTIPSSDPELWRHIRVASDAYSGPGGWSFHGDFRNGWKPEIMGAWLNSCNRSGLDCHANLLGNLDENNDTLSNYREIFN